jgi:hypothetical protein
MDAVLDAFVAVMQSQYPGKILIFPQIPHLPLTGLKDLQASLPEVAAKLGEDCMWTNAAEETLIETLWSQPR